MNFYTHFAAEGEYEVDPKKITIKVGQTAVFRCTAHGDAVWKYNGNLLPPNAESHGIPNSDQSVLTITNVVFNNAGNYLCTGLNNVSKEAVGMLYVTSK